MLEKFFDHILPKKNIIGIDIGSSSIKIVSFSKEKEKTKIKAWGNIPIEIKEDGTPEEKREIIADEIKRFLKKMGIQEKYAATSVSGNSVIVRYVKLPKMTKKELSTTINIEAEPFIPFDINDIYLSYYILNENIMEEGQQKMEVVLIAAKKDIVDEKIDIITRAGLDPVIIDVDSFAIENFYTQNDFQDKDKSVLFLNIGNKVTNLSIVAPIAYSNEVENVKKEIQPFYSKVVRDIFISSVSIEKAISKNLAISLEQAKEYKKTIKILITDDDKMEAIRNYDKNQILASKIIVNILKDLCSEVSRSIDFYLSQGIEHNISKIYLSGGLSSMKNISSFFQNEFKVPVELLNPMSFIEGKNPNISARFMNIENSSQMIIASGLALRNLKDWE